ncbi:hypothetical protein ABB37_09410 [Leptomonas pyrrhocoris]|uniref:Uncharacterized protein n=1 Tax=Leptomonas pyrrhocoris TaxID=157538 RepID=A0A0M9FR29_LEPPY|nr:hypothetical protein ABB37_09410 [Leptomonas pyrrhocoris]KPA74136.1 hypothetical protein ABB37_09410 [Leptomonas pyrrhocoris]|eukprot:XP_015652575.1 hypothetical protein ABB37_09410 [Leptomonas pyrrhocoris]
MAATGSLRGRGDATHTGHITSTANALDDPHLLGTLVKSAKSAYSTLGRALDTTLSHQRFGGAQMEPSALTMNRLKRERQLRLQQELQRACGDTSVSAGSGGRNAAARGVDWTNETRRPASPASGALAASSSRGGLHIPALPTMAPSMTAAADDGTESLGGTKIGGDDRGYVTLIGAVPTFATTRKIEDNYELISSFRAYRTDAQRMERQAALRDFSAPHPDLLEQLAPLIQQRRASRPLEVVDVETLPYGLRQAYAAQQQARSLPAVDAQSPDNAGMMKMEEEIPGATMPVAAAMENATGSPSGPLPGTWPFTCQGRVEADRVKSLNYLPGYRQPAVGQYHVRYGVVEPRVTGGYVMPQAPAPSLTRAAAQPPNADGRQGDEGAVEERRQDASVNGDGDRYGADAVFGLTMRDDVTSIAGARHGTERSGEDDSNARRNIPISHGENVKGSSMFLSQVPRQVSHGTAAPDVYYWPYPDARSTAKRTPCLVQLDVLPTQRRREPLVSGVPASVYEVSEDIAANQPRTVTMDRTTGRGTHWYGRAPPPTNGELLDVDQALRATRAKERAATLPPRTREGDGRPRSSNHNDTLAPGGASVGDTAVSVEHNLNYPRSLIGDAAQLARVRDFGKVPSRAEREARATLGLTVAYQGDDDGAYDQSAEAEDGRSEWTEARSRSAIIHSSAPGHNDMHASNPTELGEVPSLALTKPRVGCVTDLGKGSARPVHMVPLHDLTYDVDGGYALTGGRVKGTPSIGKVVTRQQAGGQGAKGCGASVMYDPTNYLSPTVKLVPDFEKQITKEREFRGHRVQSERYTRLFPAAPGPGHYTVNYSLVE